MKIKPEQFPHYRYAAIRLKLFLEHEIIEAHPMKVGL